MLGTQAQSYSTKSIIHPAHNSDHGKFKNYNTNIFLNICAVTNIFFEGYKAKIFIRYRYTLNGQTLMMEDLTLRHDKYTNFLKMFCGLAS